MLAKALQSASASAPKVYVEDVFSTWLYTGNGSTQTITNGIDLAGKGGLVWLKRRDLAGNNVLFDTAQGTGKCLLSNTTDAQATYDPAINDLKSFNSNGFTLGSPFYTTNNNGNIFTSWTFRKAAKFFDVVTYTGDGNASKTISHNLGSTPGFLIVKRTNSTGAWQCYHRGLTSTNYYIQLNSTTAQQTLGVQEWAVSSADFTVYGAGTDTNINGATYVAYLFAHDAGGFGDSGNDSVVSCGSYTGNGSTTGPTVTLGWEPQWLLVKRATVGAGEWTLLDTTRGLPVGSNSPYLYAESSNNEGSNNYVSINPTGFQVVTTNTGFNINGSTYIYIAIRRGPMKTPTDATKVLTLQTRTGDSTENVITVGFPSDFWFTKSRNQGTSSYKWVSGNRLTGLGRHLSFNLTDAELNYGTPLQGNNQNDVRYGDSGASRLPLDETGTTYIDAWFRRAPGFFDVVAYTGTGANRTVEHNLGVAPELMIVKSRSSTTAWEVYSAAILNTEYLRLNETAAKTTGTNRWNSTSPTSSVFSLGTATTVNAVGPTTYIAYLFASCPGVSKVGSYTGTGTTLNVDCGFTAGARFVLIKRTDSTGDWYVWDTARGIVSGNDPYLLLNSTAAEDTATDYIDPLSTGFQISSTAPAAINANGGSFIYLAVA